MAISVRRRVLLEDNSVVNLRITEAKQQAGEYNDAEILVRFKVIDDPHEGHEFPEWFKLHKDEETGEIYVKEGTKTWELLVAAEGEDGAEKFTDPRTLVGRKITARVDVRGKSRKRNGIQYGSIRPYSGAH